jgi:hypothetical protein
MEADVVPVAGQGAVLDAAAIQRKAHMRAAIVEREDTIFVVVGAGFKSESRPASIRNTWPECVGICKAVALCQVKGARCLLE